MNWEDKERIATMETINFVRTLTKQLNNRWLGEHSTLTPDEVKDLIIKAADEVLVAATKGITVKSQMEQKEVGYVVAALMFDQPGFNRGAILHAPKKRK